MSNTAILSRRQFVVSTAAGIGALMLGSWIRPAQALASDVAQVNDWIVINPDDTVIIRTARSEMGQGSMTGLAQMVVEELECDWSKVSTEYVSPRENVMRNGAWGDLQTGGSGSIRESHDSLFTAGAAARVMLVQAAALGWGVTAGECSAENGVVHHRASGRSARYGELAGAAAKLTPPAKVTLKEPKDWKLAGKSIKRLNPEAMLSGRQVYGIDITLPNLLNAAVRACPVHGGKIASVDTARAAKLPGVRKIVRIDDSKMGVIADTWWQAKTAVEALDIEWRADPGSTGSSAAIDDYLRAGLEAGDAFAGFTRGTMAVAKDATKTVTGEYSYPFQAHAPMEPINATVLWTADRCEMWAPTQSADAALTTLSKASGHPVSACEVHRMNLGGGFGRRLYHDYVAPAVALAKAMPGVPVKMIWSREEDMTHDAYHPITRCRLTGTLDAENNLTSFHMKIAGQSIRATHQPERVSGNRDPHFFHGLSDHDFGYAIPNILAEVVVRNTHLTPGAWRGVHLNQNVFYRESFIDELAHAAGVDPVIFRRALLQKSPQHLGVMEAAAKRIGWGKSSAKNRFYGIALSAGYGSFAAIATEVSVEGGKLRLHRMVGAIDCGHAINPHLVERQAEGCYAFGLSACLHGGCSVEDGVIINDNFDSFPLVRMMEMPRTETIVMPSGGFWGGAGEPPVCAVAPAVCNAIFAATGTRVRTLPLKNHGFV